jgi:hypothetical protein
MLESTRELVLQALETLFKTQEEGQPTGTTTYSGFTTPNAYDFEWTVVQREPLTERETKKRFALAITETDEQKSEQIQCQHCYLQITLEFNALLNRDEVPSSMCSMILSNMARRIREDPTLGGIAINVRETGNTTDVDSWADRMVNGAMFISVLYKHALDDPRAYVGRTC